MRVGIVTNMCFPEMTFDNANYFKVLEIINKYSFWSHLEIPPLPEPKDLATLKEKLVGRDLVYLVQPSLIAKNLSLSSLDDEKRINAINLVCSEIHNAAFLGAKVVLFASGEIEGSNIDKQKGALFLSLDQISKFAADYPKLKICIEPCDTDKDKKYVLGSNEDAKTLMKQLRKKYHNIFLCIDLSHLPLLEEDPVDTLITLKQYIGHIHLANSVTDIRSASYGDKHPRFLFPGSAINTNILTKFLQEINNQELTKTCWVAAEVRPQRGEDSTVLLQLSEQYLKNIKGQ